MKLGLQHIRFDRRSVSLSFLRSSDILSKREIFFIHSHQSFCFATQRSSPVAGSIGSLRYRDYRLRTTAGRALSYVCSTGLIESCKYRTLRLHYRQSTTREEAERETTRKYFLVFITVHKNASQFCM